MNRLNDKAKRRIKKLLALLIVVCLSFQLTGCILDSIDLDLKLAPKIGDGDKTIVGSTAWKDAQTISPNEHDMERFQISGNNAFYILPGLENDPVDILTFNILDYTDEGEFLYYYVTPCWVSANEIEKYIKDENYRTGTVSRDALEIPDRSAKYTYRDVEVFMAYNPDTGHYRVMRLVVHDVTWVPEKEERPDYYDSYVPGVPNTKMKSYGFASKVPGSDDEYQIVGTDCNATVYDHEGNVLSTQNLAPAILFYMHMYLDRKINAQQKEGNVTDDLASDDNRSDTERFEAWRRQNNKKINPEKAVDNLYINEIVIAGDHVMYVNMRRFIGESPIVGYSANGFFPIYRERLDDENGVSFNAFNLNADKQLEKWKSIDGEHFSSYLTMQLDSSFSLDLIRLTSSIKDNYTPFVSTFTNELPTDLSNTVSMAYIMGSKNSLTIKGKGLLPRDYVMWENTLRHGYRMNDNLSAKIKEYGAAYVVPGEYKGLETLVEAYGSDYEGDKLFRYPFIGSGSGSEVDWSSFFESSKVDFSEREVIAKNYGINEEGFTKDWTTYDRNGMMIRYSMKNLYEIYIQDTLNKLVADKNTYDQIIAKFQINNMMPMIRVIPLLSDTDNSLQAKGNHEINLERYRLAINRGIGLFTGSTAEDPVDLKKDTPEALQVLRFVEDSMGNRTATVFNIDCYSKFVAQLGIDNFEEEVEENKKKEYFQSQNYEHSSIAASAYMPAAKRTLWYYDESRAEQLAKAYVDSHSDCEDAVSDLLDVLEDVHKTDIRSDVAKQIYNYLRNLGGNSVDDLVLKFAVSLIIADDVNEEDRREEAEDFKENIKDILEDIPAADRYYVLNICAGYVPQRDEIKENTVPIRYRMVFPEGTSVTMVYT
ncbi:MAG: hypothetical protein K5894_07435, partial [Lachnospiraceae bacterium]|nr:hypothetical protein [Lachnospiraceae bacterium]